MAGEEGVLMVDSDDVAGSKALGSDCIDSKAA
jgi:hypothetical protein